ncbi:MAG: metalloregulator ArsR/SmtB family transcription factor [Arthrobacter sp.]|jgi:ArsR family transcriptional regulator|nr:metalloregulator ArsR/SmtB family transcription factor [Arthrobacter sp.]
MVLGMPREEADRVAQRLRALADPTRVQLLALLVESADGRRSVTELADALGLRQPTVSHHLSLMAAEGLVTRTQDGRVAWYSVAPSRLTDVVDAMRSTDPVAAAVAPPVLERIADDLAPRFAGVLSAETVDRYVRESYELLAERARITRYLPSLTARFAADRLSAVAAAEHPQGIPRVLFVCVQNAGRSQLAAAILRSIAGDAVTVLTAGSAPVDAINPFVVSALDEVGVPVGAEFPKPLTDEVVRAADVVVTMGCGDACPVYPGRRYLDWDLPDPAALSLEGVRSVRDDIEARVRLLLSEMNIR